VSTRLISDELDLNLSTLAAGLIIVIIVVVCGGWSLALDATVIADRIAVSDGMLIEGGGRTLVVLVGDVGHYDELCKVRREYSFELSADDDLTAYGGVEAVVLLCRKNLVAKDWIEDGVVGRTEKFSLQLAGG
jgi:hypothetical protein